jgi:hypothetical protein
MDNRIHDTLNEYSKRIYDAIDNGHWGHVERLIKHLDEHLRVLLKLKAAPEIQHTTKAMVFRSQDNAIKGDR